MPSFQFKTSMMGNVTRGDPWVDRLYLVPNQPKLSGVLFYTYKPVVFDIASPLFSHPRSDRQHLWIDARGRCAYCLPNGDPIFDSDVIEDIRFLFRGLAESTTLYIPMDVVSHRFGDMKNARFCTWIAEYTRNGDAKPSWAFESTIFLHRPPTQFLHSCDWIALAPIATTSLSLGRPCWLRQDCTDSTFSWPQTNYGCFAFSPASISSCQNGVGACRQFCRDMS